MPLAENPRRSRRGEVSGGRLVLEKLYEYIRGYNNKIFADKKDENLRSYFSSAKYTKEEYLRRYG